MDAVRQLKATGTPVTIKDYGGDLGVAVCSIDGIGTSTDDCPSADGYWHLWVKTDAGWASSEKGASQIDVSKDMWLAWSWETDPMNPTVPGNVDERCIASEIPADPAPFDYRWLIVLSAFIAAVVGALIVQRRGSDGSS